MRYIIDRIEENIAICEDENGNMVEINVSNLPNNIKEGDCLQLKDSQYIKDEEYKLEKEKNIKNRINKLWK